VSIDYELPQTSDRLIRLFSWYAPRFIRKHFNAARLLGDMPDTADPRPMLIYLNHPSWWDPMTISLLISKHFMHRPGYGPIEAEALEQYKFMAKLGYFGIDPETREGSIKFLKLGSKVLTTPNQTLWVTAQGQFTDPRDRPIDLRPGIAHLAKRVSKVQIKKNPVGEPRLPGVALPLAVEYPFWIEKRPEMLMHFGQPIELDDPDRSVEQWHALFTEHLTDAMDRLSAAARRRDTEAFTTLLDGQRSLGFGYDFWQRAKALFTGRRFESGHGRGLPVRDNPAEGQDS
jgi:1-acyl-sn-glycerol-3-phosphate acyltransferase